MKTICLYFQVHQPFRLRRYRFFDIGNYHYYYDDFSNRAILRKIADNCYLPANKILLDLINESNKNFKVTFSITGTVLEQFEQYAPEVIESFRKLADTGCVEFLAETYAHSLVALKSKEDFAIQTQEHTQKIEDLFGVTPKVFRNTELIYSDGIGEMVAEMGYEGMLIEGAKHILGWKSPHYLYYNAINPKLKLLLRDYKLSDDIAYRFCNQGWSEWPLTAEKYVGWLNAFDQKEEVFNLFMDYETFGEHQKADSGIFDFLRAFPKVALNSGLSFSTPSEIVDQYQPVAPLNVPYPISWADEERDLSAWLGNDLQEDAFNNLYTVTDRIAKIKDPAIRNDWHRLQSSDHFYYMCTKIFADGDVHKYFNPFGSPYDAFINYMNVVSDFIDRVNNYPVELVEEIEESEVAKKIKEYESAIEKLKNKKDNNDTSKKSTKKKTTRKRSTTNKKTKKTKE